MMMMMMIITAVSIQIECFSSLLSSSSPIHLISWPILLVLSMLMTMTPHSSILSPPLFLFSPLQHRQTAASSQTASKQLLCNIGWVTDWLTWLVTSGSLPGLAGREKHGLGLDRAEAGCWVLGGNDICLYSRHSTRDCLITTLCTQNSKYITF